MIKSIWANNSPYSKVLLSVGIILISAVFFTILSSGLSMLVYGISAEQMGELMKNPTDPLSLSILKLVQTVSAIGTFIVPPFVLAYLFSENPVSYLALDKKPQRFSWIIATLIMIFATPFINFLGKINSHMHLPEMLKDVETWMRETEEKAAQLTKAFLIMNSPVDLIINLFMIGFIPAVGEELLFRGVLQKIFHQWSKNIHVAVWITAILFSAMHMQFYGFIPRMVLGGMLGYMFYWSGSLWLPIIGHFINNAAAVIFIYLYQNELSSIDPDKIGTESDFMSVSISLAITICLFILLYKREKNKLQESSI